jgi:hypothetical protein
MSDDTLTETWKDIQGHPGYQVSDQGRVRTCRNRAGWATPAAWRLVGGSVTRHGYVEVTFPVNGRQGRVRKKVHHLVLEAFVGPRPPGMETRHSPDRDRANNRLSNLAWGTRQENADDRQRDGTQTRGEECKHAKLTATSVRDLRALRQAGWSYPRLATHFGISRRNVIRACEREHWAHVR